MSHSVGFHSAVPGVGPTLTALRRLWSRPTVPLSPEGNHSLPSGRVERMTIPAGRQLRCTAGIVWITADSGGPDIVLTPGLSHRFSGKAAVIVQALRDARIVIGPA